MRSRALSMRSRIFTNSFVWALMAESILLLEPTVNCAHRSDLKKMVT